jgi:hypothetical protein
MKASFTENQINNLCYSFYTLLEGQKWNLKRGFLGLPTGSSRRNRKHLSAAIAFGDFHLPVAEPFQALSIPNAFSPHKKREGNWFICVF